MKKFRKLLAVVLSFSMILSMGAVSTFAYEDVEEGTKVSEAVGILSNLGIIEGFEDGTFRPKDTVTRAQMAAIICRTLGYEDQAQGSAGSTVFDDVAASHWASGYINVAQSLGIINGYGNGNFGPEDQVTYEQAVKMIVVALGYELDAQSKGGWSSGYLAVASREGITKNANGTVGAAAVRSTIAILVYNSLEVRLMDQKSWTTNGSDEYGKTDETILSQYLGVQKWEGVVTEVPFSEYAQNGYDEYADTVMSLGADSFYTEYQNGREEKQYDSAIGIDCSLVADANNLVGKRVIAYIGEEEDDETGNRMVYAIAEKQGANKSTKISATQLVGNGDKYYNESDVIGYRNVGSSRINSLDLDDDVEIIVNFGAGSAGSGVNTTSELEDLIEYGGTIEFISNDNNAKIDIILVTTYSEEAVIREIDVEDEMIIFDTYKGTIEDIDTEDEDTLVVVIRDGVVADLDDLDENDTVSIVGTDDFADDSFRVLYVSSNTVTGTVESYDDEVVEIDDNEYEISPLYGVDTSALSGEEGIFFLNVDGQISWAEADSATKGNYGVVIAAGTTTGINSGYEIEVVLADGSVKQYGLGTRAYIEDVDGTDGTKSDDATYQTLIENMAADGAAYRAKAANLNEYVFEVTVKNGKITKLTRVEEGSDVDGKEYDEENMLYGSISLDESTVVFSVGVSGNSKVYNDDIAVGEPNDFFTDGEGENYTVVAFDEDNNDVAGLVLGYGMTSTIPQESDAIILTSVRSATVGDYDGYEIRGMQGGKVVSYTICDDEEDYTGDTDLLKRGNVILLGAVNSNGVATDFDVLYSVDEGVQANDIELDEIYYVEGYLDEDNAPTSNKFHLLNARNSEGTSDVFYDSEDGITMRNSANYTLVDYTESRTNPEVSKKSKGTGIFGTLSKYNSKVFVRYFEEDLVEVVVYRYNNADLDIPTVEEEEETPAPTIAVPTANVASGEVASGTEVSLSAEESAKIYYTLDGTAPTEASTEYTTAIAITEDVTIKAIAVEGGYSSEVATFTYTLEDPAGTQLELPQPVAPQTKEEETAPVVEETKEEETTPAVEETKEEETTPVVEETKEEETAPVVEETKEEETTPVVEETKEEETTPAVEETKEEETTPAVEETKEEETAPAVEETKEEETAPAVEETKEEETTPVAEETKVSDAEVKAATKTATDIAKTPIAAIKKDAVKDTAISNVTKVDATAVTKAQAAQIEKAPASVIESAAALTKTNLNKATYAELAKLDGITDAIATKIIEYRAKNGEFKSIEDLKKVDGVTDTIYDKVKNSITV